jgi:AcrR family transcriptional regulator
MPIEVRREEVLNAALRLILRDGYSAATMEAVAREAALAKPRVYAAYPGRGALLVALLERERQRALASLERAMPAFTPSGGPGEFDATLLAAAGNLLTAAARDPGPWRLLMTPAQDGPPEVREHAGAIRGFALEQLRALIAWGQGRSTRLARLDPDLLARSLLVAGEDAVRQILADPGSYTPQRYVTFLRHLLTGSAPPAAADTVSG